MLDWPGAKLFQKGLLSPFLPSDMRATLRWNQILLELGQGTASGRSPGGGQGNLLQYSYLENPHGQRSLAGYSPWGGKESDTPWHTRTQEGRWEDLTFWM